MADVTKAINSVLREEDSTLSGTITDTAHDAGGKTRFGIASRFHPELEKSTFYTTMDRVDALQVATLTIEKDYAEPLAIGSIESQAVAEKLLSFAVNAGVTIAAKALQNAVNRCGTGLYLYVDGQIGPQSIVAINRAMPVSLLNSFRLRMIGYYVSICRASATQREFLCGWIDRALM